MPEFNLPGDCRQSDYDDCGQLYPPYEPQQERLCDWFGCGQAMAEGSPSDCCVAHTIEIIADEIQETPLVEKEKIAELMVEIAYWRGER